MEGTRSDPWWRVGEGSSAVHFLLTSGAKPSDMVMIEDNHGSFVVFGHTVFHEHLGILRGRFRDYCGKTACVCLASWTTAHPDPDQLHLSVFHIGLLVRFHLKKEFSFGLKTHRL